MERINSVFLESCTKRAGYITFVPTSTEHILQYGEGWRLQMVLTEPLPLMNAAANGVYPNAKTLLDVKFIYHFGDSITVTKQFITGTSTGFISSTVSFKIFK